MLLASSSPGYANPRAAPPLRSFLPSRLHHPPVCFVATLAVPAAACSATPLVPRFAAPQPPAFGSLAGFSGRPCPALNGRSAGVPPGGVPPLLRALASLAVGSANGSVSAAHFRAASHLQTFTAASPPSGCGVSCGTASEQVLVPRKDLAQTSVPPIPRCPFGWLGARINFTRVVWSYADPLGLTFARRSYSR